MTDPRYYRPVHANDEAWLDWLKGDGPQPHHESLFDIHDALHEKAKPSDYQASKSCRDCGKRPKGGSGLAGWRTLDDTRRLCHACVKSRLTPKPAFNWLYGEGEHGRHFRYMVASWDSIGAAAVKLHRTDGG